MEKKIVPALIAIVVVLIEFSSAVDYCSLQSCDGKPHTLCTYPEADPSPNCESVISTGLSENEKQRIVNLHNQLRQKVARGQETRGSPGPQPPTKYMPNLEWDNELATIAQSWANQCTFEHDQCRDVRRFIVGQNIAYVGTTEDINTRNVEEMVQMWYDEVEHYSKHDVARFSNTGANNNMIGHYTQLVWAKSTKIGCGAMRYKKGPFNKFYLVCNYGPAGNFIGEPVYETR